MTYTIIRFMNPIKVLVRVCLHLNNFKFGTSAQARRCATFLECSCATACDHSEPKEIRGHSVPRMNSTEAFTPFKLLRRRPCGRPPPPAVVYDVFLIAVILPELRGPGPAPQK